MIGAIREVENFQEKFENGFFSFLTRKSYDLQKQSDHHGLKASEIIDRCWDQA